DVHHPRGAARHEGRAGLVPHPDVLEIGQRSTVEAPSRDGHCPALLIERLRVAQIDQLILGKLRMQRDVHVTVNGTWQAGPSCPVRSRAAGNRMRVEHAVADDAETTGAL